MNDTINIRSASQGDNGQRNGRIGPPSIEILRDLRMVRSSILAKGLLVAASVMSLTAVAVPAAAQPGGGSYDPCAREANGRGIAGGLIGGGLGAAVGANAAARGNRQDGALLGGALGAIAGAVIGNKSAACGSANNNGYYDYNGAPPPPPVEVAPPPRASYGGDYYADRSYYNQNGRGYRRGFVERRDVVIEGGSPVGADGCTLAESPIYLPDGSVQKRFVRVCQDSSGRYQVVN
jgi:hypothetical protein